MGKGVTYGFVKHDEDSEGLFCIAYRTLGSKFCQHSQGFLVSYEKYCVHAIADQANVAAEALIRGGQSCSNLKLLIVREMRNRATIMLAAHFLARWHIPHTTNF